MILNYLTASDVLVWSAALSSASIPDMFDPSELFIKNKRGNIERYYPQEIDAPFVYVDGSIARDIPVNELKSMFNVNACIV